VSTIKRAALDAIAAAFQAQLGSVPVKAIQAAYEKDMVHPSVQLLPKRFVFTAFQDEEVDDSVSDKNLVVVGAFEGQVELRVAALSKKEREDIQDQVWNALNQDEYRIGVLLAQTPAVKVAGTQFLYAATVSCVLPDSDGTEEWREEAVFESSRYSYVTLDFSYPALVSRAGVYTIDHLRVAFTEDLTSDNPAISEEREINQDGTTVNV
jgi:hypothetical protein